MRNTTIQKAVLGEFLDTLTVRQCVGFAVAQASLVAPGGPSATASQRGSEIFADAVACARKVANGQTISLESISALAVSVRDASATFDDEVIPADAQPRQHFSLHGIQALMRLTQPSGRTRQGKNSNGVPDEDGRSGRHSRTP